MVEVPVVSGPEHVLDIVYLLVDGERGKAILLPVV